MFSPKLRELARKCYLPNIRQNLLVLLKWTGFSLLSGLLIGGISTLFSKCLGKAIELRSAYSWLLFLLPLAGLAITALYRFCGQANDRGTNFVIASIHANEETPARVAPLIFLSTILTQLCGGSAGREGAALQIGGSLGNLLGKIVHLDDEDRHVLIMCGMSAAFAALFGTPMAAAVFSLEMVSVGVMYYAALVPCVLSALIASHLASMLGVHAEQFSIVSIPNFSIQGAIETVLLGILCAAVSILLCIILHKVGGLLKTYVKNPYLRAVVSAVIVIVFALILPDGRSYLGAGSNLIEQAIQEETIFPAAFLLKMFFTAVTLGGGFKGGEIVPSFCVGAAFGCFFGQLFGFAPSLCAAMSMVAVFCGVTNCPITSILIAFELFGFDCAHYMILVIAISYAMSGYYGLYADQTIVYSKYRTRFINRKTNH